MNATRYYHRQYHPEYVDYSPCQSARYQQVKQIGNTASLERLFLACKGNQYMRMWGFKAAHMDNGSVIQSWITSKPAMSSLSDKQQSYFGSSSHPAHTHLSSAQFSLQSIRIHNQSSSRDRPVSQNKSLWKKMCVRNLLVEYDSAKKHSVRVAQYIFITCQFCRRISRCNHQELADYDICRYKVGKEWHFRR